MFFDCGPATHTQIHITPMDLELSVINTNQILLTEVIVSWVLGTLHVNSDMLEYGPIMVGLKLDQPLMTLQLDQMWLILQLHQSWVCLQQLPITTDLTIFINCNWSIQIRLSDHAVRLVLFRILSTRTPCSLTCAKDEPPTRLSTSFSSTVSVECLIA